MLPSHQPAQAGARAGGRLPKRQHSILPESAAGTSPVASNQKVYGFRCISKEKAYRHASLKSWTRKALQEICPIPYKRKTPAVRPRAGVSPLSGSKRPRYDLSILRLVLSPESLERAFPEPRCQLSPEAGQDWDWLSFYLFGHHL